MASLNLAEAKARFSELVARAECGEAVDIMRRGQLVARLVPAEPPKQSIDLNELRAHWARLAPRGDDGETVMQMRREARY